MKRKKQKKLTPKMVYRALSAEARMYRSSYREVDGKVRDEGALHTIRCLEYAMDLCAAEDVRLKVGVASI